MSTAALHRVEVMHGVNLDQLHRRPVAHYGPLSLPELERVIAEFASELSLQARFFHTNAEHEFIEHLHRLEGMADAIVVNPGAWTHTSRAIRDALEIANLPTAEVHLSDIENREEWRRHSVIKELCVLSVSGKGPAGYRDALARLAQELGT